MAADSAPRYVIRRKILKLAGAAFHVYDAQNALVGYCNQKAFRLKEDLRLYTDETKSVEVLRILTPHIIDFSATYNVSLPDGGGIGSYRRRGGKSILRDTWDVHNSTGAKIAEIREDSALRALARRGHDLLAMLMPQSYSVTAVDGRLIAALRTHINPVRHSISVSVVEDDAELDDLMLLAGGCLLAAIEGRQ